jgi:hypothetical protein
VTESIFSLDLTECIYLTTRGLTRVLIIRFARLLSNPA